MATEVLKPGEICTMQRDQTFVVSGSAPPTKLRQSAWYPWRYRGNWWMHMQVAIYLAAP